jgi:hypothetical protein
MSVTVYTARPKRLLAEIRKAIDESHIDTWVCDEDGDFTHSTSSDQWKGRAWFHPMISQGALTFGLLGRENVTMTKPLYGIYHGRFIAMLLTHFDTEFDSVTATALGDWTADDFKASNMPD